MKLSNADIAWYLGAMLGMSAVYTLLGLAGIEHHLLKLLISGGSGIGIGWLLESQVKLRAQQDD